MGATPAPRLTRAWGRLRPLRPWLPPWHGIPVRGRGSFPCFWSVQLVSLFLFLPPCARLGSASEVMTAMYLWAEAAGKKKKKKKKKKKGGREKKKKKKREERK